MFLKIRPILILIICINLNVVAVGQNIKDSILTIPLIKVSLAVQMPEGDLKNYFGILKKLKFIQKILEMKKF